MQCWLGPERCNALIQSSAFSSSQGKEECEDCLQLVWQDFCRTDAHLTAAVMYPMPAEPATAPPPAVNPAPAQATTAAALRPAPCPALSAHWPPAVAVVATHSGTLPQFYRMGAYLAAPGQPLFRALAAMPT
jgi:hypothetical protein